MHVHIKSKTCLFTLLTQEMWRTGSTKAILAGEEMKGIIQDVIGVERVRVGLMLLCRDGTLPCKNITFSSRELISALHTARNMTTLLFSSPSASFFSSLLSAPGSEISRAWVFQQVGFSRDLIYFIFIQAVHGF